MTQTLPRQEAATELARIWPPSQTEIEDAVRRALAEDIGPGDITTAITVPAKLTCRGLIRTREDAVMCGLAVAEAAFRVLDPSIVWQASAEDGESVSAGDSVATVWGSAAAVLSAERVALNFLQRLSGIATATSAFVRAVAHTRAQIIDTRKTTPGLRALEKYAVRCGGGRNHRFGLFDGVLIKDNHIVAAGGDIVRAVAQCRAGSPHTMKVEVEVDRLDQIEPALRAGADAILLDNMSPEDLTSAVHLIRGRALTEASGGVTIAGVAAIAETGVDLISAGSLTHSVRAVDITLELEL